MTARELIKKYRIQLSLELTQDGWTPTGTLRVFNAAECNRNGDLPAIKALKPEILAILLSEQDAEETARRERDVKIAAIPGLREIETAIEDLGKWYHEFGASFDGEAGGGAGICVKPDCNIKSLCAKYPVAKAYLDAKKYADSENWRKATAGKKAVDAIINGEDYEQAVAKMKEEWRVCVEHHIWD